MPFPPARLSPYNPGRQLVDGADMNNLFDAFQSSQQLLPLGGTQAAAAPVNASQVELITSAAAGVVLPLSYVGAEITIFNNSGNAQSIYPAGTEQIQAAGASTAVSLASAACAIYRCVKK